MCNFQLGKSSQQRGWELGSLFPATLLGLRVAWGCSERSQSSGLGGFAGSSSGVVPVPLPSPGATAVPAGGCAGTCVTAEGQLFVTARVTGLRAAASVW